MFFFIVIASILYFCSLLELENYNRNCALQKKLFDSSILFYFGILFIFLGGIRWNYGTDWKPYYIFFERNEKIRDFLNDSYSFEVGYTLLNWISKNIVNNYTFFLFIFHTLIIIPKIKIIKDISIYPILSLFLFFCMQLGEISAIRNYLAVSILLLTIPAIEKKEIKKFVIITLVACSIHISCIIWFFSYFIYHKKITKKKWIIIFIISIVISFTGKVIVKNFVFGIVKIIGNDSLSYKMSVYFGDDYSDVGFSQIKKMLSLIKKLFIIPLYFIYYNKLVSKNKYNKGLINLFLFGNAFQICFFNFFYQLWRCVLANVFLEIILLPELIMCIRNKAAKYLVVYLYFFYGIMKLYNSTISFKDALIPYRCIFFGG